MNRNGNESVSSEPRMSIVKFIFRALEIAGETIRSSYCLLALAAMIAGGGVIAFSQNVSPDTPGSSQVIQFLAQTIDWYRHQAAVQAIATDPGDLKYRKIKISC